MGIPVVTMPAKFVRGRFALAMYRQMGYTDLVAEDLEVHDPWYHVVVEDLEVHDPLYHVVVTPSSWHPELRLSWHSPLYEYPFCSVSQRTRDQWSYD